MVLLRLVHPRKDFPEITRLGYHLFGDLIGGCDSLRGALMYVLPFSAGARNARSEPLQITELGGHVSEFGCFQHLHARAKLDDEWRDSDPSSDRHRRNDHARAPDIQ